MKLISYEYHDKEETKWQYSPIELSNLNLFVGDTATGKSRLLNTIFNLGTSAVRKPNGLYIGCWDVTFSHKGQLYQWELESEKDADDKVSVIKDNIWQLIENSDRLQIVQRDKSTFIFKDEHLPHLSLNETSIILLQDEPEIQPLYNAFSLIKRRVFSQDALEKVVSYSPISHRIYNKIKRERDLQELFNSELNLNGILFILGELFPDIYTHICDFFKGCFPFIEDVSIRDITEIYETFSSPARIPVFCIKEKNISSWIELGHLSSGMQKVLLIITDILSFPDQGIYLIDEYENSLGPSAIEFLPDLLDELEDDIQLIVTSHHPYLIRTIPVDNWYVFHRRGNKVTIRYGNDLVDRYSGSKQDVYIQLINDPFYIDGVE